MPQKKFNILLVDSSPLLSGKISEEILYQESIEITGQAHNEEDTFKFLAANKPDAVLLDIDLPGVNGLEILSRLRDEFSGLIIMFTNLSDKNYRMKSQMLGADYFFDKSTEFELLMQTLHKLVKSKAS